MFRKLGHCSLLFFHALIFSKKLSLGLLVYSLNPDPYPANSGYF